MRRSDPFYIKILIHLSELAAVNHKLSLRPSYFLRNSFSDFAKKKRRYYQSFYNLLRYQYLQKKLIKGVEYFEITQKGKYKTLKYYLKEKPKQKWDGKWRLALFDIPEEKQHLRKSLRENLQLLGFVYFQKSVWICPYDTRRELGIIVDHLGLHRFVQFAIIEYLEGDEKLRKQFKLA